MKSLLCRCPSPVLGSSWNQTRGFIFYNGVVGFFLPVEAEQWGNKRKSTACPMRKCSPFLTHCRNCLCERKIVCYWLSRLALWLDFSHVLPLLFLNMSICTIHATSWRAELQAVPHACLSTASGLREGAPGKKQECFFFLSQLEISLAPASHPRHHRPPSGVRAAGLMAAVRKGPVGGCFHFPVAEAGISGSSVSVAWTTHNLVSSWTVMLSHNFPTETDSLVYVDVWTVL